MLTSCFNWAERLRLPMRLAKSSRPRPCGNQNHPGASDFHWQAGYGVFSVSQSNVPAVREYIQDQVKHHAKKSLQDEMREWLRRYGMNGMSDTYGIESERSCQDRIPASRTYPGLRPGLTERSIQDRIQ